MQVSPSRMDVVSTFGKTVKTNQAPWRGGATWRHIHGDTSMVRCSNAIHDGHNLEQVEHGRIWWFGPLQTKVLADLPLSGEKMTEVEGIPKVVLVFLIPVAVSNISSQVTVHPNKYVYIYICIYLYIRFIYVYIYIHLKFILHQHSLIDWKSRNLFPWGGKFFRPRSQPAPPRLQPAQIDVTSAEVVVTADSFCSLYILWINMLMQFPKSICEAMLMQFSPRILKGFWRCCCWLFLLQ